MFCWSFWEPTVFCGRYGKTKRYRGIRRRCWYRCEQAIQLEHRLHSARHMTKRRTDCSSWYTLLYMLSLRYDPDLLLSGAFPIRSQERQKRANCNRRRNPLNLLLWQIKIRIHFKCWTKSSEMPGTQLCITCARNGRKRRRRPVLDSWMLIYLVYSTSQVGATQHVQKCHSCSSCSSCSSRFAQALQACCLMLKPQVTIHES